MIHQRPALIQELTWRPKYGVRRPAAPDIQHGSPLLPSVTRKPQAVSAYGDPNTLIAQWGNVDNSVKLYRVPSYATRFRMVVAAEPIATLAHAAAARSLLLDEREAPQREAAREKKEAEDRCAAEEKARSTNKATFRP